MPDRAHIEYTLHLADNALILGHRNGEWTGHGPILEQDIALSNIALDLIGQARYLYQHAAGLINEGAFAETSSASAEGSGARRWTAEGKSEVTEDRLAYGRDAWDFRNCLLVEQGNGDWGKTILRQFLFSAWQYYFYERLQQSRDRELAAIAEKSLKEVTYHLRWSSEWVIRLGDGTEESHERMARALDQLWTFTGELFMPAAYEQRMITAGIAVDPDGIRSLWEEKVGDVMAEAQLEVGGVFAEASAAKAAPGAVWMQAGGKEGRHTEHLGYLLAEMQFLQRAYPDCEW
jgi:ring-1,2-phenylacetyl-CoA epoxidase subunit PaaC